MPEPDAARLNRQVADLAAKLYAANAEIARLSGLLRERELTPEQRQRDMTADDIAIERAKRQAKSLSGEGE